MTVANGSVDNPAAADGGGVDLPFAMQGQDLAFKAPTSYPWSAGVQREIPFGFVVDATYVGRRGPLPLQRERNINQLPDPRVLRNANQIRPSGRISGTASSAWATVMPAARSTTACS